LFQKGFIALGDLYTTHTRILYLGKLTSIHINSPLLNSKSYLRDAIEYLETICLGSSIVCITESHLDDKVSTQDILISGYLEPFRLHHYLTKGVVVEKSK
jgi:hypothetical protein